MIGVHEDDRRCLVTIKRLEATSPGEAKGPASELVIGRGLRRVVNSRLEFSCEHSAFTCGFTYAVHDQIVQALADVDPVVPLGRDSSRVRPVGVCAAMCTRRTAIAEPLPPRGAGRRH
jgi:hypothetical protein